MHGSSSRAVSGVSGPRRGVLQRWLPVEESEDDDRPPQELQSRWHGRLWLLSLGVLGLLTLLLGVVVPSNPLLQRLAARWNPLGLWSSRHDFNVNEMAAECAIDTSIAASYLARGAGELAEATKDCPEVDEIKSELYRELSEHPDFRGPALGAAPPGFYSQPSGLNASAEVDAACARAQATLNSLHIRIPRGTGNLRRNRTLALAEKAARRLADDEEEGKSTLEVLFIKEKANVKNKQCTSEIAGVIGAWSWVAGYLASASSECAGMQFLDRYCASDIARTVAAISDIVQAATGIASSCTPLAKRTRRFQHYEEKKEEFERWKELLEEHHDPDRRLHQQVHELPPSPQDQLMGGLSDLADEEDEDDEEKKELIEEIKDKNKEDTLDQIHRALCGTNAAQGALFIGRAALEIIGALEHCKNTFDRVEMQRCAANSQGAFAAFAVTSHVLAEATAQCQESFGKLNLPGFCAASIAQVLHAVTELSAALVILAADCVLMIEYPFGRPEDLLEDELEKAREGARVQPGIIQEDLARVRDDPDGDITVKDLPKAAEFSQR